MEKPVEITKKEAKRLAVSHSALATRAPFGRGKNAVFNAIDHLGYIQIDTISVVARAHHHSLWNRVPNHDKKYLHQLQAKDKRILEYWAHAAAYLPMTDYRYTMITKQFFKEQKDRWPKPDRKIVKQVFDQLKSDGPLMARDFEHRKRPGQGWWDWKPAKWALERLFFEGDLVVRERKGFQKVYDLPENVIPDHVDTSFPSYAEYAQYLIRRSLQSFGMATIAEICYQRPGMRAHVQEEVQKMVAESEIVPVQISGKGANVYYASKGFKENMPSRIAKKIRILSPFDNLVIQRKRTKEIFGFDYQIECYVPKPKRKYGYFSLPLLYGDQFVGRMDTKADRKSNRYHIFNLVLEEKIKFNDQLLKELSKSIWEFATFNDCNSIEVIRVEPKETKDPLLSFINSR